MSGSFGILKQEITNAALTRPPGIGKSALLATLVSGRKELHWAGFISESLIRNGDRVGWRIRSMRGGGGVLAHVEISSKIRMGRYGIDMELFARTVHSGLADLENADAIVIDEFGLISELDLKLEALFTSALDSSTPVIALAREKSHVQIQMLSDRPDTNLIYADRASLSDACVQIEQWLERAVRAG
jgi:nucleoside-triphosphatase THEP1